jgi:hypothetical protein
MPKLRHKNKHNNNKQLTKEKTMNVQNMTSSNGNKVANQFVITNDDKEQYYQSYNSIIVKIGHDIIDKNDGITVKGVSINTYLDKKYWNFSNTTSKYRNKFLNETTKETIAKIKSGEYKLVDLNAEPISKETIIISDNGIA